MRGYLLGVMLGIVVVAIAAAAVVALLPGRLASGTAPGVIHRTPAASHPGGTGPGAVTGQPRASATMSAPTSATTVMPPPTASVASASPTAARDVGLRIGQRAPALDLPLLGGGRIDSESVGGRPVWVNFTASWCPTCRDELRLMQRIESQLGEQLRVIVVDVREDEQTAAALVDSLGLTLPVALDADGRAQDAWGAFVLPVHYWLDAEGRVRGFVYGGGGPDVFLRAIRTVLPGASIEL